MEDDAVGRGYINGLADEKEAYIEFNKAGFTAMGDDKWEVCWECVEEERED